MRKRFCTLLLVAAIIAGFPLFGADFTHFTTHDLIGRTVDQSVFSDKKLTMVSIWATSCGYCRMEMPSMEALRKAYPDLQVVGILTDVLSRNGKLLMNQVSVAQKILKQTGLQETTLLPESAFARTALDELVGVPTKYYVDRNGVIVYGPIAGMETKEAMEKTIVSLLAKLS